MTNYYSFLRFFNNVLLSHPNVTTFTVNEVEDIDLKKQTLFPLAHLVTETMLLNEGKMTYTFTLMVADRVAATNRESSGSDNRLIKTYRGVDNTVDVINTAQMTVADVFAYIKRNTQAMDFTINNDILITPFVEKGPNIIAGVEAQFIVDVPFDVNACLLSLSANEAKGSTDDCCGDTNFILQETSEYLLQETSDKLYWKK
jgi:hypothetical protein